MTDTRTEHTPGKDTRLWCLHHIGADDIHAAPDFETAQAWANWANGQFAEHADISRFVVAVWPWTADDHAENLPRSIAEWTVPAASEGEAVAWMWKHASPGTYSQINMHFEPDAYGPDWACTPLYTRPAPSDQSKLVADLVEAAPEAANLLEQYAAFILTVKADELKLHPYQPAVEQAASALRAAIAKARGTT